MYFLNFDFFLVVCLWGFIFFLVWDFFFLLLRLFKIDDILVEDNVWFVFIDKFFIDCWLVRVDNCDILFWVVEDLVCLIRDFLRFDESLEDVYLLVILRAGDVEFKRLLLSGFVCEVIWLIFIEDLVFGVRGFCKFVKLEFREVVSRREFFKFFLVNREEDVVRLFLRVVFFISSFLFWTEVLVVSCFFFLFTDNFFLFLISLFLSSEFNKFDLLFKILDFVFLKLDFVFEIKKKWINWL